MSVQAFSAEGVPFSMTSAMRGGDAFSAEGVPFSMTSAMKGGKAFSDHKKVAEAWKSFKNNTKHIKDKSLKIRVKSAEQYLKNTRGGTTPVMDNGISPEHESEGDAQAPAFPAPNDSDVLEKLREMNDVILKLVEDVAHIKSKVGIDSDDHKNALEALEILKAFIMKHTTQKLGGNASKNNRARSSTRKYGGEPPGSILLNGLYAPEVGSSVTLGGSYASAMPNNNTYMLQNGGVAEVHPTMKAGRKNKSKKRGGNV